MVPSQSKVIMRRMRLRNTTLPDFSGHIECPAAKSGKLEIFPGTSQLELNQLSSTSFPDTA